MAQPTPSRPILRRQSSKVRFSRGDMSPVGTMVSDSDLHSGPAQHHSAQTQPLLSSASPPGQRPSQPYDQDAYDINTYPFGDTAEISLSQSQDRGVTDASGRYRGVPSEEVPLNPYDTSGGQDHYTATPPRPSARRFTGSSPSPVHRPTLDTVVSASDIRYTSAEISPRNTSQMDSYQMPPIQSSPAQRPSTVLRPALVGSHAATQRSPQVEHEQPYSPRPSIQPGSPAQQSPRPSMQPGSPALRRPYDGHRPSGNFGSPRDSPRPDNYRPSVAPGYRRSEYEDRTGLTPAPVYGPPRNSYFAQHRDEYGQDNRYRRLDSEYEREREYRERHERPRYDSETTLRGDDYNEKTYDEKKRRDSSPPRRPRAMSDTSDHRDRDRDREMRRRATKELEDAEEGTYTVKGGVFSQLLRLTGRNGNNIMRRRQSSRGIALSSRGTSACGEELPTMHNLGLKKVGSTASTTFGAFELDQEDPRVTGQKPAHRRASFSDMLYRRSSFGGEGGGGRRRRASIQRHVADLLTRQQFILKLAKALMIFGAPSHRLESQLSATAMVLELDAQFIHLPSIVMVSFGDTETKTSETVFIKASGGLELGKLHKVHSIYRAVVHDEMEAGEGTRRIHDLLKAPKQYNLWQRIILAFLCAGITAPMSFGGSFIDGLASGVLGTLLAFMQLHVASKNAMYSNIFEISIATVVSFSARGLATTGLFCYQAVCSAGVVLILPGYAILCGSLELASKNIVSGSVRMVYAIIYSLFLGFGITIGSDLFYVFDRPARRADSLAAAALHQMVTVHGTFAQDALMNMTSPDYVSNFMPFNGTFTFSNSTTDDITAHLNRGAIICSRPDGLPWYRQAMPPIYNIGFVPLFSFLLCLWNMQPLRSRQLPVMVVISCVGYAANTLANHYIFDRSDVVSAIGAFVIGILGNIYSRVFGGTAFTSMVTGVLFLVPSGMAAAGGLAMTQAANHDDSYSQGLVIAFRMITVAIGITVGLFGSGLLIYSFGRKKGAALFAF